MKIINKINFKKLPDAIFLDIDNTIYNYDIAHNAAFKAIKDKAMKNFSINAKDFEDAYKESKKQIKLNLQNTASSHSRLLYMQRMLEIIGLKSQILLSLDFEQTYWRNFLINAKIFHGVLDVLEDIRLLNIPIVAITDLTAQIQFRKIIYFGLDNYFDYVVTSEEAGIEKPNESIFQLAIRKINIDKPRIWMIGDNLEKDIIGAKLSVNAITLQKKHTGVEIEKDAKYTDLIFDNFLDIHYLLKSIKNEKNRK
jgi:putative hydrolase of the HAD superfamily